MEHAFLGAQGSIPTPKKPVKKCSRHGSGSVNESPMASSLAKSRGLPVLLFPIRPMLSSTRPPSKELTS
jgi:hypothetical protein